jgi:hypothetical protein
MRMETEKEDALLTTKRSIGSVVKRLAKECQSHSLQKSTLKHYIVATTGICTQLS